VLCGVVTANGVCGRLQVRTSSAIAVSRVIGAVKHIELPHETQHSGTALLHPLPFPPPITYLSAQPQPQHNTAATAAPHSRSPTAMISDIHSLELLNQSSLPSAAHSLENNFES